VAFFGVIGIGFFTPSTRASGCHVPDRPTFGLPDFLQSVADSHVRLDVENSHPSAYSPIPCDGETPGTVSIFALSPPAISVNATVIEPPRSVLAIVVDPALLATQPFVSPLARPPRSTSV